MADTFAGYILAMLVCGGRRIDNDIIIRRKPSVEGIFRLFSDSGLQRKRSQYHGTPEERSEAVQECLRVCFPRVSGLAYDW